MMDNHKQSVALSSVLASGLLIILKLTVGVLTGSIGILSEAAHSALDFGAATLTYFAVKMGDQPADERHPSAIQKLRASLRSLRRGFYLQPRHGSSMRSLAGFFQNCGN